MKLAIMQPYLFPYVGYYQLIRAVDRFVIADDVAYIKGGWINRNRILVNGQPAYFTVPLKRAASDTLIRDMAIDEAQPWRRPLLKTIENYYRRAPSFGAVFPLVEDVLSRASGRIAEMTTASLVTVSEYLGLATVFVPSSSRQATAHLAGQDRVIETCVRESADDYVNAIGGQALYTPDVFATKGIRLHFLQTDPIEYPQFRPPFVPGLSIIDLLMFNSRDGARALLDRHRLI